MKIDLLNRFYAVVLVLLAGGCANFSGSHLVVGRSTAAEVEATMGAPTEKMQVGGESVWFYSRQPYGRAMHAVRIGTDNVVRGVEERLSREHISKLAVGMTAKQVREIVGPPGLIARMPRQERDVWEYRARDLEWMRLWVQFSYDGIAREVLYMDDPERFPVPESGAPYVP